MAERSEKGRFAKGVSGNPTGRPKVITAVRDLAREYTQLAINTLVEIASDTDCDPRARVAAANGLLDRGFGKPAQEVTTNVNVGPRTDAEGESAATDLLDRIRQRIGVKRGGTG